MVNLSGTVQIETRIKHDLSIAFQSVVGELSINVGTLVIRIHYQNGRKMNQSVAVKKQASRILIIQTDGFGE